MGILQSKGMKRTLAVVLLLAAKVPQLAAYAEALNFLGGLFGVTGLAHAGIVKFTK